MGRLVTAKRWDQNVASGAQPSGVADVELHYGYDASDMRVSKRAVDTQGEESYTLYIFGSLELRRTEWNTTEQDFHLDSQTEVAYLFANGVRLARLAYEEPGDVPSINGENLHVFFELGDHLGSTSVVLDKATSELVERSTYQAYGGSESDYRPERWKHFREDYRFTGKEEDVEVGLIYFGKRFLNPLLNRWVSADPLAVHGLGADANLYAYVSGEALKSVDLLGLIKVTVRLTKTRLKQLSKAAGFGGGVRKAAQFFENSVVGIMGDTIAGGKTYWPSHDRKMVSGGRYKGVNPDGIMLKGRVTLRGGIPVALDADRGAVWTAETNNEMQELGGVEVKMYKKGRGLRAGSNRYQLIGYLDHLSTPKGSPIKTLRIVTLPGVKVADLSTYAKAYHVNIDIYRAYEVYDSATKTSTLKLKLDRRYLGHTGVVVGPVAVGQDGERGKFSYADRGFEGEFEGGKPTVPKPAGVNITQTARGERASGPNVHRPDLD